MKLNLSSAKNDNYGISLSYPDNTNISEHNNGFTVSWPNGEFANFIITPKNSNLYDVIAGDINYYRGVAFFLIFL